MTFPQPRRLVGLALVAAAVLTFGACASDGSLSSTTTGSPGERATPTTVATTTTTAVRTGPAVAARGTYGVGKRVVTFVDRSRPTQPNGSFAGAPARTLLTTIWYPSRGTPPPNAIAQAVPVDNAPAARGHGPYPLVLFSHGVTAMGAIYGNLAAQWASAGYVVAAPDYPLSNNKAPGGPTVRDTKNQPADASFVIDQVLAHDRAYFGGIVDRRRIGAAGHSLGAITTYGLVYSGCCRDPRVDAAIVLAGATLFVDAPDHYFNGLHTPLLAVHGNADPIVPYALGLDAYERAGAPKFLVTIADGNHLQPYLGGTDPQQLAFYDFTTAFFDRYLKGDTTALRRLRQAVRAPAAAATLREQLR